MLDEVPGDEGPRHASIAICKGMDLREPVVKPRRHQQRVIDLGFRAVLPVPVEEVVELRVDVFRRAVLVNDAVGPGGVVGQRLECAGM